MFKVHSVFCLLALTLHHEHFFVLNFLKSIGYSLFQGCVGWLCCNSNGFCPGELFAVPDWVTVPVLELHLWEPGELSLPLTSAFSGLASGLCPTRLLPRRF